MKNPTVAKLEARWQRTTNAPSRRTTWKRPWWWWTAGLVPPADAPEHVVKLLGEIREEAIGGATARGGDVLRRVQVWEKVVEVSKVLGYERRP